MIVDINTPTIYCGSARVNETVGAESYHTGSVTNDTDSAVTVTFVCSLTVAGKGTRTQRDTWYVPPGGTVYCNLKVENTVQNGFPKVGGVAATAQTQAIGFSPAPAPKTNSCSITVVAGGTLRAERISRTESFAQAEATWMEDLASDEDRTDHPGRK
jgi:hypothetical protein